MTEHEILWACSAFALYMLTVLIGWAVAAGVRFVWRCFR